MGIVKTHAPPGQDVPLTVLVAAVEPGARRSLDALAARLATRLGHAVEACAPGRLDRDCMAALGARVRRGTVRLVVLPVALSQADRMGHIVDELIASVLERWPGLCVHRGLAPHPDDLARVLGDRAREATAALSRERATAGNTVVVLVGASGASPAGNAELAGLARLVYEAHRFADVGYAFLDLSPPTIRESIGRWARLGAGGLVVVPALLFPGRTSRRIAAEARDAARDARITVTVARPLALHPAMVGALVRRHLDALRGRPGATGSVETVPYVRPEILLALRETHTHDGGALAELEARVTALLPPATGRRAPP
jgi:sirohydrochlorin ferrochelatase